VANELTIEVENLRGLRHVRWAPSGVGALVGPNGAGKTTLLLVLELLRQALERGLPTAVENVLGGSYDLVHHDAAGAPCRVVLQRDSHRWEVELRPVGPTVEHRGVDQFLPTGDPASLLGHVLASATLGPDERTELRRLLDLGANHPGILSLSEAVRGLTVFHDYALGELRRQGSDATQAKQLQSTGANTLALLRTWNERRTEALRLQFVKSWLSTAFPEVVSDFDFDTSARSVHLRLYRPGDELPISASFAAQGVLSMLVSLTAIAAAPPGALVAIDEPEHGLHPFAIRRLVEAARSRFDQDRVSVVFATHSPVLLNTLGDTPEKVWVMERDREVLPVPLTDLKDRRWLAAYSLGEAYENTDYGAPGR
jgi:predicted ATPase